MEFLSSFLRRHFAGKPVVASRNVGCFLRLEFERLLPIFVDASSASCWRLFFFAKSSPKFHESKEGGVAMKAPCVMHWSCLHYLPILYHSKTQTANSFIQPGLSTKLIKKTKMFTKPLTRAFFLAIGWSYLHDLSEMFLKGLKLLWGEIACQKRFIFYR